MKLPAFYSGQCQKIVKKLFASGCLFLALAINPVQLLAQTLPAVLWDKTYGGSFIEKAVSIKQTSDNGFIIGGWSNSALDGVKSDHSQGSFDYWIVKTDAAGNMLWDKTFGGTDGDFLEEVIQTSDNGYLVGGTSNSPLSGHKSQERKGFTDYWVVKIDAAGNKLWDRSFGGDQPDAFKSMQQTPDGGFILGGTSSSKAGSDKSQNSKGGTDYWIIKIDAHGNKIWDKTIGGSGNENLSDVKITPDGSILLTGSSTSYISGDKTSPVRGSGFHPDFWIVKLDANGNILWDQTYGGTLEDHPISMVLLKDGSMVVGGYSRSPAGSDKTFQPKNLGIQHLWVLKLDPNGNKIWDKNVEVFSFVDSRFIGTRDNEFLIGTTLTNGFTSKPPTNGKSQDFEIIKLDSLGNRVWDKMIGSNEHEYFGDLLQTSDNGFVLVGSSEYGASGNKTHPGYGKPDYWIVKLGPEPELTNPGPIRPNFENDCAGTYVNFTSPYTANTDSVRWHFDDPQSGAFNTSSDVAPYHNFTGPGTYNVTLTAYKGRTGIIFFMPFTVNEIPEVDLGKERSFCAGSPLRLANLAASKPGQSYLWNTGDTTASITVTQPGTYTLKVGNGSCFTTATVTVKALFCSDHFLIPNIVTPNHDGLNDKFVIKGVLPQQGQLKIYNRWGTLVYENEAYDNTWPDQNVSPGTYYYFLYLPEFDKTAKGWVEIAR